MAIKLEIIDCYKTSDLSEADLKNILSSASEAIYNED